VEDSAEHVTGADSGDVSERQRYPKYEVAEECFHQWSQLIPERMPFYALEDIAKPKIIPEPSPLGRLGQQLEAAGVLGGKALASCFCRCKLRRIHCSETDTRALKSTRDGRETADESNRRPGTLLRTTTMSIETNTLMPSKRDS